MQPWKAGNYDIYAMLQYPKCEFSHPDNDKKR